MASTKNPLHRLLGIDLASHGDLSNTKLDSNVNLEVICLGLSRTGTTSLQAALTKLGYGPSHQGVDLVRSPARSRAFGALFENILNKKWRAGDPALTDRLHELMKGYRSSTDNPINYLTPEIYAAYPDAKYILTLRPGGKEAWFKSLWDTTSWFFRRDWWRTVFISLIYPVTFLRLTDNKVQLYHRLWDQKFGGLSADVYDKHNAEVMRVIPKEQLLVYDVREGWEPLTKFLGVDIPTGVDFPNTNDTKAMQAIFYGFMLYGALTWTVYIGGVAGLTYLAVRPEIARGYAMTAWNGVWKVLARQRVV